MVFKYTVLRIVNLLFLVLFGLSIFLLLSKLGILIGIIREMGIDTSSLGVYPYAVIITFSFVYVFSFMLFEELKFMSEKELEKYIFEEIDYI